MEWKCITLNDIIVDRHQSPSCSLKQNHKIFSFFFFVESIHPIKKTILIFISFCCYLGANFLVCLWSQWLCFSLYLYLVYLLLLLLFALIILMIVDHNGFDFLFVCLWCNNKFNFISTWFNKTNSCTIIINEFLLNKEMEKKIFSFHRKKTHHIIDDNHDHIKQYILTFSFEIMTKDCKTFVIINTNLHVNMTVNNQYKFINFIESSVNDQSDDECIEIENFLISWVKRIEKNCITKKKLFFILLLSFLFDLYSFKWIFILSSSSSLIAIIDYLSAKKKAEKTFHSNHEWS